LEGRKCEKRQSQISPLAALGEKREKGKAQSQSPFEWKKEGTGTAGGEGAIEHFLVIEKKGKKKVHARSSGPKQKKKKKGDEEKTGDFASKSKRKGEIRIFSLNYEKYGFRKATTTLCMGGGEGKLIRSGEKGAIHFEGGGGGRRGPLTWGGEDFERKKQAKDEPPPD